MRHAVLGFAFCLIAGGALAQGSTTDLSKAPSGAIPMEVRHTEVQFTLLHNGPVDYWGRFDKVSGDINFNPMAPEKSTVTVAIDPTSVNFKAPELVQQVVAKDALDAGDFPQITFKSTSVTRTGPTTGTMTGDFTLKGITKPLTFNVTFLGATPTSIGFHATADIKRSDFNMISMRWTGSVSDDVRVVVDALFQKPRIAGQ